MAASQMATPAANAPEAAVAGVAPKGLRAIITAQHALVCGLAVAYMATSAGLIHFNKWLMHEDRFPYSVCMACLHMAMSSVSCLVLITVKPGLFPALTERDSTLRVDRKLMLTGALPIAVFFALSVCLSNTAYLFAGVSFLQMMKEANVAIIYFMSLLAALEIFSLPNLANILAIILATTLTVKGEVNFVFLGFVVQFSAMVFECSRIVMQTLLLSPQGRKLDPLSYCAIVTPVCLCVLLFAQVLLSHLASSVEVVQVPAWHVFAQWWPFLLANSAHAFVLNVLTAVFLKNASAVAFILTGIVKDAAIVLSGCVLVGERISRQQLAGFILQLALVAMWSLRRLGSAPPPQTPPQRCAVGGTRQEEREPLLGKTDSEDERASEKSTEAESQGSQTAEEVRSRGSDFDQAASDVSSEGARARKSSPQAAELV